MSIGIFCAWSSTYSRAIAIAAAHRAREAGYRPIPITTFAPERPDPALAGYVGLFGDDATEAFLAAGTRAVNVSEATAGRLKLPSVLPDNFKAGQLAAQHLLERNYNTVVFVSRGDFLYARRRAAGVRAAVSVAGGRYLEVADPQQEACWKSVPLPFGVVGADDTVACWAMETVMRMGLQVPGEVAVIGITNDEFECITAPVPLSSVDLNASAVGNQAARLLLRLIAGRPAPAKPVLVRPAGVITRASSDMLATEDPLIARVVRHARDRLSSGIQVADLARKFGMSRQHLDLLFRQRARFTPVQMLRHLAVVRARQLLTGTDLTLHQIAGECGYTDLPHFGVLFRKLTGTTPAAYRKQWRTPRTTG
jgi:LacI family transcriptional regulator